MTAPIGQGNSEPQVIYVQEKAHWGRRILLFIGIVGLGTATLLGLMAASIIPKFGDFFSTQETDRSGPVLLESMQDLSHYVAAEGTFSVLVDLQENNRWVPNIIFNERTLFVGVGSVDAYVDFAALTEGAIVISPDGSEVTVTLPAPMLEKPSLDTERSYVFATERGLVNRVGDVFSGNPNDQKQLYQLAEEKITEAAIESELRDRAEKNTRAMLESLLHQLGYQRVDIVFLAP